jgi:hypothetical protein
LDKCAEFPFFQEARVVEKRRRRFALPFDKLRALSLSKRPAQSKKGFVECGGKRSATPLFFAEQSHLGDQF